MYHQRKIPLFMNRPDMKVTYEIINILLVIAGVYSSSMESYLSSKTSPQFHRPKKSKEKHVCNRFTLILCAISSDYCNFSVMLDLAVSSRKNQTPSVNLNGQMWSVLTFRICNIASNKRIQRNVICWLQVHSRSNSTGKRNSREAIASIAGIELIVSRRDS